VARKPVGGDGFSLTELAIGVALLLTLSAVAAAPVATAIDESRTWGAAHYLAARMNLARADAVKRSVFVALRIQPDGRFYRWTFYADGNGNGVRTADITANVDKPVAPADGLHLKFSGVTFGIVDGVKSIDPGPDLVAGSDPVRFGKSDLVSFSPDGSATAGTIYIRGRGHQQAAVRVLGVTGRVRPLWFNFVTHQWEMR
jgi:type II secretory pathway pseudopilin PulG